MILTMIFKIHCAYIWYMVFEKLKKNSCFTFFNISSQVWFMDEQNFILKIFNKNKVYRFLADFATPIC